MGRGAAPIARAENAFLRGRAGRTAHAPRGARRPDYAARIGKPRDSFATVARLRGAGDPGDLRFGAAVSERPRPRAEA